MGFLGTAAMTAAGVAGGMLAANALTSMFSGGAGAQAATPAAAPSASSDQTAAAQPSTYEEPGYGSQAEPASYDDGGDFGGGDDWA